MKRFFDLTIALSAFIALTPLFLLLVILIRLNSRGSSIFRQERVGRNEEVFQLFKFRSMQQNASGPQITLGDSDPRITGIGHWMRKFKIDELPQLWNIIKGDMSFVGPRPEVAKYVALYTPEEKFVLTVRPGLTDPASIQGFNEAKRIESANDPEMYYREVILKEKLAMQIAYIRKATWASDCRIIGQTLLRIFQRR
ncbi:MAG TPA: glycosyl transferase [Opitutae bacterium]|nr:glycosyl transferase [Opitutae bacterium]